ncbi:MAG: extracellular solute-binding protein [Spirochaetales bacterium]|nr:extracellular solute-binding protein [Spirochaetales bacterium]
MNLRSLILLSMVILLVSPIFAGEKEKTGEKVIITWWNLWTVEPSKSLGEQIVKDYMAAHPNVEIQPTVLENEAFKQKVNTMMQSGNPPDVFQSWGGGVMNEFAEAGLLRDISPELKGEWLTSLGGEGLVGLYGYKEKFYGVPYDMGAVGFWYNKDLFKKVGYEKPPATWTELVDCIIKLKAAGVVPIALGEGDKWPGHFWWVYLAVRLGGKEAFDLAYSRKGSFADAPFVKAGEMLLELVDLKPFQDGFLGQTYNDQAALMGNGQAGMELMGQWAPSVEAGNATDGKGLGDNLGFFSFPMVEGGKGKITDVMGGGNGFIVGKNAPDEAVDFLKYITGLQIQTTLTEKGVIIPTIKGAETAIKDPMMKMVHSMVSKATYYQLYYDQYLAPAVGETVKDATQLLFAEQATAKEAADMIEKAMADSVQ